MTQAPTYSEEKVQGLPLMQPEEMQSQHWNLGTNARGQEFMVRFLFTKALRSLKLILLFKPNKQGFSDTSYTHVCTHFKRKLHSLVTNKFPTNDEPLPSSPLMDNQDRDRKCA